MYLSGCLEVWRRTSDQEHIIRVWCDSTGEIKMDFYKAGYRVAKFTQKITSAWQVLPMFWLHFTKWRMQLLQCISIALHLKAKPGDSALLLCTFCIVNSAEVTELQKTLLSNHKRERAGRLQCAQYLLAYSCSVLTPFDLVVFFSSICWFCASFLNDFQKAVCLH